MFFYIITQSNQKVKRFFITSPLKAKNLQKNLPKPKTTHTQNSGKPKSSPLSLFNIVLYRSYKKCIKKDPDYHGAGYRDLY